MPDGGGQTMASVLKRGKDALASAARHYSALSPREKYFVVAASVMIAATVLDLGVAAPLMQKMKRLDRQMERIRRDIQEMYSLRDEHKKLESKIRGMKPVTRDFSIFHHLETIGSSSGVKMDSIKPGSTVAVGPLKETSYDVKMEKVGLYQLTDILYKMEKSQEYPLRVKRMTIRPNARDKQFLEVSLQIATIAVP